MGCWIPIMMFSMGCEFSTSMVHVSLSFEVPLDTQVLWGPRQPLHRQGGDLVLRDR